MFLPSVTCQPCGDRLFSFSIRSRMSLDEITVFAGLPPPIVHEFHNSHLPASFNCVYIWLRRKNEAIPEQLSIF